MRTLVVTAGDRSHGNFIRERWVDNLRKEGEYSGDILILNYDLNPKNKKILLEKGVYVKDEKMRFQWINADRHRGIYEALTNEYGNYDVVLCIDGDDTRFFKSLQPLFDAAKEKVRFVKEWKAYKDWYPVNRLLTKYVEHLPYSKEMWEKIRHEGIINGGVYVGPIDLIIKWEKFLVEHYEKYGGGSYISDQLWAAVLVYHFKFPAEEIDDIWNRGRAIRIKHNKCTCKITGKEIAILHKLGGRGIP